MTKLNHMTAIIDITHAYIFPGRRFFWILSVTGWRLVELHSVRVDLQPAADHTHTHTHRPAGTYSHKWTRTPLRLLTLDRKWARI